MSSGGKRVGGGGRPAENETGSVAAVCDDGAMTIPGERPRLSNPIGMRGRRVVVCRRRRYKRVLLLLLLLYKRI